MSCVRCNQLASVAANRCHGCDRVLPIYPGMYGAGFESRTIDHLCVSVAASGVPVELASPKHLSLCLTCYRADQKRHGEPPLYSPPFDILEVAADAPGHISTYNPEEGVG